MFILNLRDSITRKLLPCWCNFMDEIDRDCQSSIGPAIFISISLINEQLQPYNAKYFEKCTYQVVDCWTEFGSEEDAIMFKLKYS